MLRLPEFENIEYLKHGSPVQVRAYNILIHSKILYHLKPFDPILTGTIPIDLFIEGKSDLDIACCSADFDCVEEILRKHYASFQPFSINRTRMRNIDSLIISFPIDETFIVEVFCQDVPTKKQLSYRHMVVEYELMQKNGAGFKQAIMKLKHDGFKTEPAFARVLQLEGDPYVELLNKYDKEKN